MNREIRSQREKLKWMYRTLAIIARSAINLKRRHKWVSQETINMAEALAHQIQIDCNLISDKLCDAEFEEKYGEKGNVMTFPHMESTPT